MAVLAAEGGLPEAIWAGATYHPDALLLERSDGAVLRHGGGRPAAVTRELPAFESLLTAVTNPPEAPEAFRLRRELLGWPFDDGFRTDAAAPAHDRGGWGWERVPCRDRRRLPWVPHRRCRIAVDGSSPRSGCRWNSRACPLC